MPTVQTPPLAPALVPSSRRVTVAAGVRKRSGPAWVLGLRDLQWRRRRFMVTVVATGLVFALALLMTGIKSSFDNEIDRTVASMGADTWLVASGSTGPFTAPVGFPASAAEEMRRAPGVERADPIAVFGATTRTPETRSVNVIGMVPGGVGAPAAEGSRALARGEAVVDRSLELDVGDQVDLNGRRFRVGALTEGLTYFAGQPTIKVSLEHAQRLQFAGQPVATSILVEGAPASVPRRFASLSNEAVAADLERPMSEAKQTITLIRSLLWLVAAGIIGAVVYLSALERVVDFAVMKAIGVSTRSLVGALLMQAFTLAVVSALLGFALEALIAPTAAMSVEVPFASYVTLLVVAIVVGTLASMVALRRAVKVDPALAFGG